MVYTTEGFLEAAIESWPSGIWTHDRWIPFIYICIYIQCIIYIYIYTVYNIYIYIYSSIHIIWTLSGSKTLVQITRVLKVWGLWFCDLIFDENDKGGDENVRHF